MQLALWLPHEPMRSRETPLHTYVIIFLPYTHQFDLKQMIAGFVSLLVFLCSPASEVQATVESGCASEGSHNLFRDDVSEIVTVARPTENCCAVTVEGRRNRTKARKLVFVLCNEQLL